MATNLGLLSKKPRNEDQRRFLSDIETVASKVRTVLDRVLDSNLKPSTLYEAARHLPLAGGKMLRPYLAAKSCEIVEGDGEKAIPAAAAVELLHTFTLVHDDIMDNDSLRRGVPTVHVNWGRPIAIIAGDLLFSKVYDTALLLDGQISAERLLAILKELTEAAITVCEGQVLDVSYPSMERITEEEYLNMIGKKTACLFKSAARIGSLVGGATSKQTEKLGKFAFSSALGFQIVDDLLGLTSSEDELRKPIGTDLREGKKTLPVIHALQNGTVPQRRQLLANLGRELTRRDIDKTRKLIAEIGSIEYATKKAHELAKEAIMELSGFQMNQAKESLLRYAELLINRKS